MQSLSIETSSIKAQQSSKLKKDKKMKIIVVVFLFLVYIIYRIFLHINSTICIIDEYQNITEPVNRMFVLEEGSAFQGNSNQLSIGGKVFIGIGQVLMDLWVGFVGLIWFFKTKNMRSFFAMGMFYLIRAIVYLNIQKFPFPNNLAWRNPGFFSFVVPYDHTRDFFYSGHTGGLVIATFQAFKLKLNKTGILSFLSLLYMINMLVTTKVHYIIDIIGGLIFAIWSYRQSIRYVIYFDKLISLPYKCFLNVKEKYFNDSGSIVHEQVILIQRKLQKNKIGEAKLSQKDKIISFDNQKQNELFQQRNQNFQVITDELA